MKGITLFETISRVHRQLRRRLMPLFQNEGLSYTEIMVLWRVNKRGDCRIKELALETVIPPSTFTGICDRLVERGLLERALDPEDRRSFILKGTPALKELIDRLMVTVEEEMQRIIADLPEDCADRLLADAQFLLQSLTCCGCNRNSGDKLVR